MSGMDSAPPAASKPTRASARRARTRQALIRTAADLLAEGDAGASIQTITDRADVAVGTFYNHFASRGDLYDATVLDALETIEQHTIAVQKLAVDDPAEVVSIGIRSFGRIPEVFPRETLIIGEAAKLRPLGPAVSARFRSDVDAAIRAERLRCDELELTLLMIAGGMTRVVAQRIADPSIGPDRVDDATVIALRMLGMDEKAADELAHRPLPVLPAT